LRFFCLCAALLTEKPPPLLILNEPETSLHPDLIAPLAELVARVPASTQLLVVTHSQQLAEEIAARRDARIVQLISFAGETRPAEQASPKRVWTFGD
jgi:predicted ATPase